ncbi:MAG: hypothetical protein EZS28_015821 [Streblomastix strix]|uniref:Uncharacterized protein n=1 Tax=Streblomastix strix TaxID=222440 RepID=A0A5J4W2A3_9EUKA|nr:MAG: hypothetical protein EZS28_015821 [Streblomastix strix]
MRNRTEIDNNIPGMDIESEGDEYKNVARKKAKNVISIVGLVQRNIQEQKREDKINSSADRQTEFPETSDKGSVYVSNGIRKSENTSVEDTIMGWINDSKQIGKQGVEVVNKENMGQTPESLINRTITCMLPTDTFSNTWTNEILFVHPPIPILSRVISYINYEATLAIVVAPWWPGQPCIPHGPEMEKGKMYLTQILDRIGLSRGKKQTGLQGGIQVLTQQTLSNLAQIQYSLIFVIPQITSTPSKLAYRAVLNCKIINRRYSNMWDKRQLFDHQRPRPDDKHLLDTGIQTKLESLLLSIYFIRINEAAGINLVISNITYRNQTVILCLSPKVNNLIEQNEIRRTGDPKVCPNSTLFTWLNRLYWHYGMDPEQIVSLFQQLDGQPSDKR